MATHTLIVSKESAEKILLNYFTEYRQYPIDSTLHIVGGGNMNVVIEYPDLCGCGLERICSNLHKEYCVYWVPEE